MPLLGDIRDILTDVGLSRNVYGKPELVMHI